MTSDVDEQPQSKSDLPDPDGFGPAYDPFYRVEQGDRGIQAYPMAPLPEPLTGPWQGRWIWVDPVRFPDSQRAAVSSWAEGSSKPGRAGVAALLRWTFSLEAVPPRVLLRVSADSRFRLWINGRLAGRGPAAVGGHYMMKVAPNWWYGDTLDVTALLTAGVNVLAVEVTVGPDNQTHFSQGQGGFIAELQTGGGGLLAVTDTGWRGIGFTGYREGPWCGFTRDCDLRKYPKGWRTKEFDDRDWPATVELPDAARRPAIQSHALPPLAETVVRPVELVTPFEESRRRVTAAADLSTVTIQPGAPLTFYVRFAQTLAGHVQFRAEASAGTRLEIAPQEIPGKDPGSAGAVVKLALASGTTAYETPAYFSARALRVTVTFPQGRQPLVLRRLGLLFRSQPVIYRGEFACSDPFLTELWRVSRWTLQLCLQEIHLDSPDHQEALGDHGDCLVEMLMAYYAFGDYALAHQDVLRMAADLLQHDGETFHTSYALLMPDIVADFWLYSGDARTARAALPAMRRVLERTLGWRGPEGLLSQAPNYMFTDWIEHAGANYHHPPAAQGMGALTAFAVRALRKMAGLCRQLDSTSEAGRWDREADALAAAFRERLFDAGRGAYRDGLCGINRQPTGAWLPPDSSAPVFTRHTNILAAWAGIMSGEEAAGVLGHVLDDPGLPEPQPYFQHYLFDALEAAGLYASRARRQLDLWRDLLAENPASLKESWRGGDYSHGWGGTPLVQLSRRVLGLEPTAPGWRRARLHVQPLDLAWARGVVPTPCGDVHVAWERAGDDLRINADAPPGMVIERVG